MAPALHFFGGIKPTYVKGTILAHGSNTFGDVTGIAPGTSGLPLLSQGAGNLPAYGALAVAGGGTGATSFTTGRIPFMGASALTEDANLCWDNAQKALCVGTTSAGASDVILASKTTDAAIQLRVVNASGGTSAQSIHEVAGDTSNVSVRAHGSGRVTTRYGVTLGGMTELVNVNGNGLLIGTFTNATPIVFGTNSTERARFHGANGHLILPELSANPSTSDVASLAAFAVYMKNDKFVIAYNNGGTMTYITLPMDGSTVIWTQTTTAP